MSIARIGDLGAIGVISDLDPTNLPPNAFTRCANARFVNGQTQRVQGYRSFATPTVAPYFIIPVVKGATLYWVYCGLAKVYAYEGGSTHTNITRQTTGADVDYTGSAANRWTGGVLNGVLVLSNGIDAPQMWVDTKLESLSWDSGSTWASKGYTAQVVRPYRNFLVALDFNDGTNRYPHTVYWSDRADPLTVPADWDFADPANEAGQVELASTSGFLVDGLQLRDSFVIYKEDAVHLMTEIGGAFVHQFREVSRTTGLLAKGCVAEFYGRHFCLGNDDVFVTDGTSLESIADRRIRRELFASIDPTYYARSFAAVNLARSEVWFCYHETGSATISRAAIYNTRDGTWGFRDLPGTPHLTSGVLFSDTDSVTWNDDSDNWDSDSTAWNARAYNPAKQSVVGCAASNLYELESTEEAAGAAFSSLIEREGLVLDGIDSVKTVRAVYPRATGAAMTVEIGSRYDAADGFVWEGPYTFTPGTDSKVRVRSTGRQHAIRFNLPTAAAGALQGYDLEYTLQARR